MVHLLKSLLSVKNLNELLKIEQKAIEAGIPCAKIEDNGNTVFRKDCEDCGGIGIVIQMNYQTKHSQEISCPKCNGKGTIAIPTITCLAVGPAKEEDLQPITGRLRLL